MPGPYCYSYPRPAVTVDLVLFALRNVSLDILLVKRKHDPFEGRWAFPGGFLELDETVEHAVLRELAEETGVKRVDFLAPLATFSAPGRDPRGRTISLVHVGVIHRPIPKVQGADDAAEADWHHADELGGLAFDHDLILDEALDWITQAVLERDLGFVFLPRTFRDSEVRILITQLGGSSRDATNWLKRQQRLGKIQPIAGPETRYRIVPESDGDSKN
jgi:8-oxo-dGTP diphosphatase